MSCPTCFSTWSTPTFLINKLRECPFCHTHLPPKKQFSERTLLTVLMQAVDIVGKPACTNGKTLLSVFSDLAPDMTSEKRLLQFFIECKGNELLLAELAKEESNPHIIIQKLVNQLTQEYSLNEKAAKDVCESFLSAIN